MSNLIPLKIRLRLFFKSGYKEYSNCLVLPPPHWFFGTFISCTLILLILQSVHSCPLPFPVNRVSSIIDIIAKVVSLLLPQASSCCLATSQTVATVEPRIQTRPSAAAWSMDINLYPGSSTGHLHQYDPWRHCDPWTSTWPQASAQIKDINMAFGVNMGHGHHTDLGCSKILAPDMTLKSNMDPDMAMGSDVRVGHSQCCPVSSSASLHSTLLLFLTISPPQTCSPQWYPPAFHPPAQGCGRQTC